MTTNCADLGGDPPCWAHLQDESGLSVDLGDIETVGRGGAIWSLPHGGDLDANLVHLHEGETIAEHVNDEVDVVVFVQSGSGELTIDGHRHRLRTDVLAAIPKGSARLMTAGESGITYLSVHRGRGPMGISKA